MISRWVALVVGQTTSAITADFGFMEFFVYLTVSISLDQQPWNHGKSNFWPKFFMQPPENQKTSN
jgi:hypothetical protein